MTAKLILSLDGALIQDYPLNKERMTIGRKADNDIVINNLAVSSQHAAVITIMNDSFMEDLDSTNGMIVNGVPAKKHFLQNNDVIEIGKYKLKYLNDHVSQTSAADFEKTMIMRAPLAPISVQAGKLGDTGYFQNMRGNTPETAAANVVEKKPEIALQAPAEPIAVSQVTPPPPLVRAAIQILSGPNAGKELELVKGLTTLGKPGVQVAVLTRRPQGFFITHVEGASHPSVNGQVLGGQPCQLQDHDLIELAGVKMEFFLKD
jgi:predicted component of type VI protein secretion system